MKYLPAPHTLFNLYNHLSNSEAPLMRFVKPYIESFPRRANGDIYYDNMASKYDSLRVKTDFWTNEEMAVKFDLNRYMKHQSTILDLPVGTGRFFNSYSNLNIALTGVDLSDEMLTVSKKKAQNEQLTYEFFNCSASEIKLPSKSIDVGISLRFLQNIVSIDEACQAIIQMNRICKNYLFLELGYRSTGVFRWRAPRPNETMRKLLYKQEVYSMLNDCGLHVVDQSRVVHEDHIGKQRIFVCKSNDK